MAAEVQPIALLRAASGPAPKTADQSYWSTFKNPILLPSPHNAGITSITIPDANASGTQADTFAVTSGSRIQIYGTKTRKLVKTVSRFGADDTARSGTLRKDGRILLAGGESGIVQAFDTSSRAILRQWQGEFAHKLPVHLVRWNPHTLTELMSCSDDRTVRIWDLTEDAAKWTGLGHEDYVRSGGFLPEQGGNIIVSGSYDQTVRVWDTRQQNDRPAMHFKLAAPVENVLALSSSSLAVAAGSDVTILNLLAGRAENVIRAHQKTVTSLAVAQGGSRILTGGLDAHLKVHNTSNWEVVAGFKYPAPILSMAVVQSPASKDGIRDDRHLAVGLQTGLLSIRTRLAGAEKVRAREREKKMDAIVAGQGDEYERRQKKKDKRQGILARDRGKDFRGEGADIVIVGNDRSKSKKLQPWQRSLRSGKYADALDQILPPDTWREGYNRDDFMTLITALRHRSALRTALADRSEERLIPILNLISRYIVDPRYLDILYDVMLIILDLYSQRLAEWQGEDGDAREVAMLFLRIRIRVRQSTEYAQNAHSICGMINLLEMG
ncbi:WD40 repeat-like protein [Dissoconium aciculare CBS 342.82]|uniref:WD40 repeat-like protein n=1 Tax=Dissoconium aciculare CBS 342.82 TaxID=1314786 RepID=A0A6J3MBS6_9PEZI|nr:WD40 repeat-like protein [Dissoconium aciculare CBS 342.82]KAF1825450.1 WD40 repeat-like protein [Dissoconium aciculare CBS 342.82]